MNCVLFHLRQNQIRSFLNLDCSFQRLWREQDLGLKHLDSCSAGELGKGCVSSDLSGADFFGRREDSVAQVL